MCLHFFKRVVQIFLHFNTTKICNSFNKQQRVRNPDSYKLKKKPTRTEIFCRKRGMSGEGGRVAALFGMGNCKSGRCWGRKLKRGNRKAKIWNEEK